MSESQYDNLSLKESLGKNGIRGKTVLILSSWFCVGLIPKARGTFGTLASVPLVFGMSYLGVLPGTIFLFMFIIIAIMLSGYGEKLLEKDDPPEIVIDEVAGFLITLFLLPFSLHILSLGFLLFRFFDILKPFPIKRLERIGGGTGIVLDDVLAGVYANLCVRFVIYFL